MDVSTTGLLSKLVDKQFITNNCFIVVACKEISYFVWNNLEQPKEMGTVLSSAYVLPLPYYISLGCQKNSLIQC